MKTCSACKASKPETDFGADAQNPDGRKYACRPCMRLKRRAQRAAQRSATTSATPAPELGEEAKTDPGVAGDFEITVDEPSLYVGAETAAPANSEKLPRFNFVPRVADGLKRHLLIPDTHRPYHDAAAVRLLLHVARSLRFDSLNILGDYIDCAAVSFHEKDPRNRASLKDEIDDTNAGLDELDALGIARKRYVMGNHEFRLHRYVMQNAAALADFEEVDLVSMLRLKQRGWEVTPYKDFTRVGKLTLTHDMGVAGVYAVRRSGEAMADNTGIGHVHSMAFNAVGDAEGNLRIYFSAGWLGDKSKVTYMHRAKANRDWVLGFAIGYEQEDGFVHVVPIPIRNYSCVVEGRLYSVR